MDELADYYSVQTENRVVFQKNFASDITVFKVLLSRLRKYGGELEQFAAWQGARTRG